MKSETRHPRTWNALKRRFDNKAQLVTEYIKRVLHLPTFEKAPSKDALLNMADRTNQLLRVMPQFKILLKHWDAILMVILIEKLDSTTERKWLD